MKRQGGVQALVRSIDVLFVIQALVRSIDVLFVKPLKAAPDDVAWSATFDRVLAAWGGLRVALAKACLEALGVHTVEETARQVADLPLTMWPEPAHGAAVYAIDVLVWRGEQTLAAALRSELLDVDALPAISEDVAVIELCWLTLVGACQPAVSVAEAAAWEAYSRARSLGRAVDAQARHRSGGHAPRDRRRGFGARSRAAERVATGWTDAERRAFEEARLCETLSVW